MSKSMDVTVGKLHEISFYGLIAAVLCVVMGWTTIGEMCAYAFNPLGWPDLFLAYMFWASVCFIPLAILGAILTKVIDSGEGLSFKSNKILVIMFAHIAEEIIGLVATPIWFFKEIICVIFHHPKESDSWKIIDFATYFIEIAFIAVGLYTVSR